MAYLADHVAPTRVVRRSASYGSLYPEEIEYLNRPVTKDADQPDCVSLQKLVRGALRRLVHWSLPKVQLQKLRPILTSVFGAETTP